MVQTSLFGCKTGRVGANSLAPTLAVSNSYSVTMEFAQTRLRWVT